MTDDHPQSEWRSEVQNDDAALATQKKTGASNNIRVAMKPKPNKRNSAKRFSAIDMMRWGRFLASKCGENELKHKFHCWYSGPGLKREFPFDL